MARTKVFDPRQALEAAMEVFWRKGFEGTSTDDLLAAMKIGRQSMYDTFGDKRQLYLAALEHYVVTGGAQMRRRFADPPSAMRAIEELLLETAGAGELDRARGCLAVNAASSFGEREPDICAIVRRGSELTEEVFAALLTQAKQQGEAAPDLDPAAGASFIHTTIRGIRISAKAGVSPDLLAATAGFAIKALRSGAC